MISLNLIVKKKQFWQPKIVFVLSLGITKIKLTKTREFNDLSTEQVWIKKQIKEIVLRFCEGAWNVLKITQYWGWPCS